MSPANAATTDIRNKKTVIIHTTYTKHVTNYTAPSFVPKNRNLRKPTFLTFTQFGHKIRNPASRRISVSYRETDNSRTLTPPRPATRAPQRSREAAPRRTETPLKSLHTLVPNRLSSCCCPWCLSHSHETGSLTGGNSHPHFGIHHLHVARGRAGRGQG